LCIFLKKKEKTFFFQNLFVYLQADRIYRVNMSRKDVVNQISQAIRRVAPTATAILYGSEARGDARPESDIDVLILLDGEHRDLKHEDELSGELYEIELATGVLVSPMIMLRKQWENRPFKTPFYVNVMNEGIKI
jgi:predicted nucleotidyltransferase